MQDGSEDFPSSLMKRFSRSQDDRQRSGGSSLIGATSDPANHVSVADWRCHPGPAQGPTAKARIVVARGRVPRDPSITGNTNSPEPHFGGIVALGMAAGTLAACFSGFFTWL
jgi:hypothetical protein